MRRLLVVAYYAPPLGLSGVMRVTKLCKYLPEHGWQPLLLTTQPAAYYHYDAALLADLERVPVFRTESLDPARLLNRLRSGRHQLKPMFARGTGRLPRLLNYLLFPDAKIGWFPFAAVAGRRIIEGERPDAIFASGPPFTALLVGSWLKACGGMPFVADFRDPWPTGFVEPPLHQRAALRSLRRHILRHADACVAVNAGTARAVGEGVGILENGFDPADFEVPPVKLPGFSIVHTGNVWRNEEALLEVARSLEAIPDACLYLAGRVDPELTGMLKVNPQVRLLGTLAHRYACRLMKSADVLLYIGKPSQPVGIKLYEYFGALRPILVYGPGTREAAVLVAEAENGLACDSPGDLAECLVRLRHAGGAYSGSGQERFDRRSQAGRLAALLDGLH